MYDLAPAKMPTQVGSYGVQKHENRLTEDRQIDAHADRLAEMITAARNEGEQKWMSTTQ
jgi:hypothetical protein